MPNNWTKCKLGDVCLLNQESLSKNDSWEFINYLDTSNLTNGTISEIQKINIGEAPSRAKRKVKAGSVLYSTVRPDQQHFGIIKEPVENMIVSTGFAVLEAKSDFADNGFLYRFLTQKNIIEYLQAIAETSTSAYPSIRPSDLENLDVNLPPLDEQKRIAGVLGAFDDKIELLQKQNKTLEDMAKAIFKSWFVDFDIVKAKQRGEDKQKILSTYKITEELYNLFPSSFTDAPASPSLGPIPTGWEVKQIKDICKMDRGLSYKSENLVPSDTALVTLKSFNRGGGYRLDGLKSYYGKYKAEQEVALKDIVVACTDVTQNAEVVGKPAIVLSKYPFKKLLASCDLVILRPYEENKRAFIWQLLMSEYYQKYILAFVSGTTVLHLNKEGINIYQFPFSSEVASYFSSLVNTYIDKIISNYNQIQTLTELRDGLLPRLLSGKLRV